MKKDNVEKDVLELKKKGLTDLAISRKLNVPQEYVCEVCMKKIKKPVKCHVWIFGFILLLVFVSINLVSASLNVQLSDQGTGVAYSNGTTLSSGDLTVLIYTEASGGSLVYNETFSNNISEGSWNVMLGSGVSLPLEFGKVYYKDYRIAGEDASFDGDDRQAFYSPLGDINGSDLATDFYINTVGNVNTTGNISVSTILFDGGVNKSLSANATSIYYFNGTSWIDLTSTGNASSESYWARNSTTNITSLANEQDNVNLTDSNITTTGTGFFGWIGSLVNRITTLFVQDINVNGTINLTSTGEIVGEGGINITGNIITTGNISTDRIKFNDEINRTILANDTTIYYFNGTDYIDLTSTGNTTSYWSRNATSNVTSLANSQDNVELANNLTVSDTIFTKDINGSGNVIIVGNVSVGEFLRFANNVNQTVLANATSVYYYNGTTYTDLGASSSVMVGANATANGTSGLVPMPTNDSYQQCLLGNGSWGACGSNYWSRNATSNVTSLANSQDNVELANNLSVAGIVNVSGNVYADGVEVLNNVTLDGALRFTNENQSLSANVTSLYYFNGTDKIDLLATREAIWIHNATTNITSLANSQDNVNLTSSNITTTGTGFFGWLGSLANRITKLWVGEINATGNIETEANITATYFIGDGSQLTNLNYSISADSINGTELADTINLDAAMNIVGNDFAVNTSDLFVDVSAGRVGIGVASPSAKLEVNGTAKIEDNLNMTSNNVTSVDCIVFASGGKICDSP